MQIIPSTPKVLFIVKKRTIGSYSHGSSGLTNSAQFVIDMLNKNGIETVIDKAIDGNCLDRLVTLHRPDVAIVEAYWVTPAKFAELQRLHPTVTWIVRNHSKPVFLSLEGIAFEWSVAYLRQGIIVACNSQEMVKALQNLTPVPSHVVYLPNYYPVDKLERSYPRRPRTDFHVGCFGAIRPMKNIVNQALAAIAVADKYGLKLHFHVNGTRIEGGGEPILKSLKAIFAATSYELIEEQWMTHDEFMGLVKTMHVIMQVSMTETFNIVAADAVAQNIPAVVSEEIRWLDGFDKPDVGSSDSIADVLQDILTMWPCSFRRRLDNQQKSLKKYSREAQKIWLNYFRKNKLIKRNMDRKIKSGK